MVRLLKLLDIIILIIIICFSCKKKNNKTKEEEWPKTVTDANGNIYKTIKIGSQVWMAANLRVNCYNNGDTIINVPGDSLSLWEKYGNNVHIGACCTYKGNKPYDTAKYGKLYNWYVAGNSVQNVCPLGWHVPTDAEWTQLIIYLGNSIKAGGALKDSSKMYWENNIGATNTSGFMALPGGYRRHDGIFSYFNTQAWFWTSSEYVLPSGDGINGINRALYNNNTNAVSGTNPKGYGFSIRCIKNQ